MIVKLLTEYHLECLSLKGGCRGLSESTHVKMPHCWKSHALAQFSYFFQILITNSLSCLKVNLKMVLVKFEGKPILYITSIDLLSEEQMALIISYRQNSLKVVVLSYFAMQIEVENTTLKISLKIFLSIHTISFNFSKARQHK